MDSEMVAAMTDILERYDITVVDSGSDHTILESIVSGIQQLFSREPLPADTEWVTACHGSSVRLDEAYTIFIAICETVYRCDPSDVTEATIRFNLPERDTISWVDIE